MVFQIHITVLSAADTSVSNRARESCFTHFPENTCLINLLAVHLSRLLSTACNIVDLAYSCYAFFISFSRLELHIQCTFS